MINSKITPQNYHCDSSTFMTSHNTVHMVSQIPAHLKLSYTIFMSFFFFFSYQKIHSWFVHGKQ